MSRIDWDDLRVFAAVAETGSLSAAARQLGATPGSLSKRIDDLEHRLQAQLLVRGSAGARLTEAGHTVYDHALTMRRSALAIERLVQDRDRRHEGRVTLALPDGVAAYWVAPRLAEFISANPNIHLELDCGFQSDEAPDISIVADDDDRKLDFVYAPLAALHYALFSSRGYVETYGAPQSLASVADHRVLHHAALAGLKQGWRHQSTPLHALTEPSLETNSSSTFIAALRGGGGVGIAPTAILTVAPELVMLGDVELATVQLWLAYRRELMKFARFKAVADWLKAIFNPREAPWFRDEFICPEGAPAWTGKRAK